MVETIMTWAEHPAAPWAVLALGAVVILVEAVRTSRASLWGDMFADDADD